MTTVNANIAAPRLLLVAGGAVRQIADVLGKFGLSRPLVVSDPVHGVLGPRAALPGAAECRRHGAGMFSDTVSDPTDTVIEAGVAELRKGNYDCLIGFGGGSPIDTAKAMAILAAGGGKMRDYKAPVAADKGALPIIAIPTTAGTGSECTRFTVITDTERDEKMLIAGLGALPLAAIVDYELTYSVPARTTADTGVDSLTHALEAYVSKRANPFSDALALSAMELIGKHIRTAYAEPRNAEAREAMMLGATQAGLAFSNSSVALVHGMSRPIGAHFHVPHGLSNAMLLPAVTRYSRAGRRGALCRGIAPHRLRRSHRRGCGGGGQADHRAGGAEPRPVGADAGRLRHQGSRLEREDAADGRAGAGLRQPEQQPRVPDAAEIVTLYREVWTGAARNA